MTQPTAEERAQAADAVRQLLVSGGMDDDEASELAEFTIGQAAQGKTQA